jgi:hypothetical protein
MKHYVYRIDDPITKEFYIGSRSCKCAIEDDKYMGSMKTWNPDNKSRLVKTILKSNFRKIETTIKYETKLIQENIANPLNRNYHIPSVGFYAGFINKQHTYTSKKKISLGVSRARIENKLSTGENNPMYNKIHTDMSKCIMQEKARGRYTLEWFIEHFGEKNGYEKYLNKNKTHSKDISGKNNGMYNKTHNIQSKQKMSESSKKKVGKYNTENKLLHIYSSINDASIDNNISISSISAVCNPNRINKTAAGFIWKLEK